MSATNYLVRVGQAYKFNAPNAKGWYILKDIRKNSQQEIELICKGAEPHTRIFTQLQISQSKEPRKVIIENEEFIGTLSSHSLYRGDIVFWPTRRAKGVVRKYRSRFVSGSLAVNSCEAILW